MAAADLTLDPAIRAWVVVPIILITFFVLLGKHYATILLHKTDKPDLAKIADAQLLQRSRLLRANGRFITPEGFAMRRQFFNHKTTGVFQEKRQPGPPPNPMAMLSDPKMMQNMSSGTMLNMLPMMVVGGIIDTIFAGFVIVKVPFPLTIAFKPMLQRGIALDSLSASWVSSMSFYYICLFGLRGIFTLILGDDNQADQTTAMMQQQQAMSGGAAPGADQSKLFQAEWEALEVAHHKDGLVQIESLASTLQGHTALALTDKKRK